VLIKAARDLEAGVEPHAPYHGDAYRRRAWSAVLPRNDDFLSDREFGEIYAHGIATNTTVIELFLNYCHEQGVTSRRLSLDQVFAAGTLDS
jgi:hypothetical protein